ncbi:hypothetical protein T484DRAFT_1892790 [Baffinella frigidus]|nr:hypothetical protein T484DRAFT_1892790 [Cryptophyta sp. CCMP2293]|eukprot:CAMPEP_0180220232 /NCGR_PEP_ID=MMETSP0987-20121128/18993_1 /TAXON_ID=697907 /ORGANISM="non described non described, Strain CCMP2293" /LENGTH=159 /DNA_ID=CAMNT_0022181091 /DNA_START=41 /DNA_END=520 /DNA_ORIENTATION=-
MEHVLRERISKLQQRYEYEATWKLLENAAKKLRSTCCQSDAAVIDASTTAPTNCSARSTILVRETRRRPSRSVSWNRYEEVFTIPAREFTRDDFDQPSKNAQRRVSFADDARSFSHEDNTGSCFSEQPTSAKPKRHTVMKSRWAKRQSEQPVEDAFGRV